jgi:DNA-binding response OmpR family regulator
LENILVIDDEEAVRDVFSRYLRHNGYAVTTAADGETGLREAREKRFDAVIVDYAMPDMNGIECASRLTALAPGVPIILLSGNRLEKEAENAGIHFLLKPAQMETLIDYLTIILSARSLPDQ